MAQFLMFFVPILFSVSFGVHYVVIRQLSRIFEFQYSWKLFLAVFLVTANFMVVIFTARATWNLAVRLWWIATVTYIGAIWISFSVLLLYGLVQFAAKFFLPIPLRFSRYAVVGLILSLVLYSLVNARNIQVKTLDLSSDKLTEPVTIVQLTDLHLGAINGAGFVEDVVARTNALEPDLVVITGDLVDIGASAEHVQGFNQLKAPVFFVWGNHDQFLSEEEVMQIFSATPIRILKNESVVYQDMLQIIGLDYLERRPAPHNDPKPILTGLNPADDMFTLLLSHAPIQFSQMDGHPIDLQLAGHTHSGQIVPFNFLVKRRYEQYIGLYQEGERALYVSSGTGTWGPPMRLGTSSEITRIRLLPTSSDDIQEEQLLVRQIEEE